MSVKVSWEKDGGWVSFTDSYGGYDPADLALAGVPWVLLDKIYRAANPITEGSRRWDEAKEQARMVADPDGANEYYTSNVTYLIYDTDLLSVEVSSEGRGGEAHMSFSCDLDDAAWDNLKKSNPDITKEMKTAGFVVTREEEL